MAFGRPDDSGPALNYTNSPRGQIVPLLHQACREHSFFLIIAEDRPTLIATSGDVVVRIIAEKSMMTGQIGIGVFESWMSHVI